MNRLRAALGVVVGTAAAGFFAVPPVVAAPVPAATVTCGSAITSDVRLVADLVCPAGTVALGVAAGVTLDLGGHAVSRGPGDDPSIPAITLDEESTLRNGRIRGYEMAVGVSGDNPRVDRLDTGDGRVYAEMSGYGTVTRSRLGGITILDMGGWQVRGNRLGGFSASQSGGHTVEANIFSGGYGVDLFQGGGTRIRHNLFFGVETGVSVGKSFGGATVEFNVFQDVGVAVLGRKGDWPATGVVIRANTVLGSRGPAFLLDVYPGTAWDVEANLVIRPGRDPRDLPTDGIVVHGGHRGVRLAENRIVASAGIAINAPGVRDGGGNRAMGQGRAGTCVGVAC